MGYCMVAYFYVMYSMGQMLQSAISESADSSQRRGLLFIHYGTVIIWSTFVVVWFGQEFGLLSIYSAEMGNLLANFAAKVRTNMQDQGVGLFCPLVHGRIEPLSNANRLCMLFCCCNACKVPLLFMLVRLTGLCR